MSRLRAGSLYAGDGVVIQQVTNSRALLATLTRVTFSFQPAACPSAGCNGNGCSSLLRYPRSSFGSGNITLCVKTGFAVYLVCLSHSASFPLQRLVTRHTKPRTKPRTNCSSVGHNRQSSCKCKPIRPNTSDMTQLNVDMCHFWSRLSLLPALLVLCGYH